MDRFLRLPSVRDCTGLSKPTLYRYMFEKQFPRSYPLGARAVGWLESEVTAWIQSRIGKPSKDAVPPQNTAERVIKDDGAKHRMPKKGTA
jgi:prophage regulatory protein